MCFEAQKFGNSNFWKFEILTYFEQMRERNYKNLIFDRLNLLPQIVNN